MDNSVFFVLGMLLSSTQGGMGIPNCNITNPTEHQQGPCCLHECDHTSEETICEYECPKDMFLSQNMLWDKNDGSLCPHGCRQTCPENYDGIRINDIQICVECFILCRLEILHTSCKCQNEKIENEENSLETKYYIIIAVAITSFLQLVGLVMVCCYWKRKRNKDNTKTTDNIELRLQNKDNSIKDENNQGAKHEIGLVDVKHRTIAKEAQRKLDEKRRYDKDPTEHVVNTRKKGGMGIQTCNLTNPIGHQQCPCCLEDCDHTSEETICEYKCPKNMFLSHNMPWNKHGGSLCPHGCRQTCPEYYDGIRINDIQICVGCFILCRLEIPHTSCKCQNEKIENEDNALETKDYIIMALAITSFLLLVGLVMVCCYWKRKRNKDNTKPTENIEMPLQDKAISIKDNGKIQETKHKIEIVDDKPKTIAKEAQRKLDENRRYVKDPTEPVVNSRNKRQSTKRIASAAYDNAEAIGLNRKLRDRVSHLFGKVLRRFGSTPDPSVTSSNDDGYEFSSFTQEHSYVNEFITNNCHLERQSRVHDPDDEDDYETVDTLNIVTKVPCAKGNRSSAIPCDISENCNQGGKSNRPRAIPSDIRKNGNQGGKSNRSNAIPSDISENGKQDGKSNRSRAIPSDISKNSNQNGKSNLSRAIPSAISENGNQGGKSTRSNAIPSDISKHGNQGGKNNRSNDIPSDISENGNQGGKSNRSRAIPSDISKNGNQGGKTNRSNAIPSDISDNGNQGDKGNRFNAIPSDISDNGNQGAKGNRSNAIPNDISENGNQGSKGNNHSSAIPSDISENGNQGNKGNLSRAIPSEISENSNQGVKSNRSSAVLSYISENSNQASTDSDTASSYETARESSASSIESGAEESVTQNITNGQIQASGRIVNIVNAKNLTLNLVEIAT